MRVTNQITLKEARIAAGLSLQEVEDKTDYSVKRITWLEENSEELTVGEMKEFCELYKVDLDEVTLVKIRRLNVIDLKLNIQFQQD